MIAPRLALLLLVAACEPSSPPEVDAPMGSSSCSCAGSLNGESYNVACGATSACLGNSSTDRPDGTTGPFTVTCNASAQVSWSACAAVQAPNCAACTDSSQCADFPYPGQPGVTVAAGCYNGACRMQCSPGTDACACISATPAGGDGAGYCSDDGC